MGEVIAALVDFLGVYVLYMLGRAGVFFFTFGVYSVEPYEKDENITTPNLNTEKVVSKRNTMIFGFVVLVVLVSLLSFQAAPLFLS